MGSSYYLRTRDCDLAYYFPHRTKFVGVYVFLTLVIWVHPTFGNFKLKMADLEPFEAKIRPLKILYQFSIRSSTNFYSFKTNFSDASNDAVGLTLRLKMTDLQLISDWLIIRFPLALCLLDVNKPIPT